MGKRTKIGIAAAAVGVAAFVGSQAAAALDNVQSSVRGGLPQGTRTAGVPEEIQTGVPDEIQTGVPDDIQT